MPTNRTRRTRAKNTLDSHKMGQLHHGPHDCLIAGAGYYQHPTRPDAVKGSPAGFYWDLDNEGKARILDQMRADWFREQDAIMTAWDARDDDTRERARNYHGNPAEPWALREFGHGGYPKA
jgi:hypothetical protein